MRYELINSKGEVLNTFINPSVPMAVEYLRKQMIKNDVKETKDNKLLPKVSLNSNPRTTEISFLLGTTILGTYILRPIEDKKLVEVNEIFLLAHYDTPVVVPILTFDSNKNPAKIANVIAHSFKNTTTNKEYRNSNIDIVHTNGKSPVTNEDTIIFTIIINDRVISRYYLLPINLFTID